MCNLDLTNEEEYIVFAVEVMMKTTPFGRRDLLNFIDLIKKYPNDTEAIEHDMNNFFTYGDYSHVIKKFITRVQKVYYEN